MNCLTIRLFDKTYSSELECFAGVFCALSQVQNLSKLILQSFNGMTECTRIVTNTMVARNHDHEGRRFA
jgi:hypothetical protein